MTDSTRITVMVLIPPTTGINSAYSWVSEHTDFALHPDQVLDPMLASNVPDIVIPHAVIVPGIEKYGVWFDPSNITPMIAWPKRVQQFLFAYPDHTAVFLRCVQKQQRSAS